MSNLSRVLTGIAIFFGGGVSLILIVAFADAMTEYHVLMMRFLTLCAVLLMLSLVAYVSVNVFLTLEYRAIQNEFFRQSKQELQLADNSTTRVVDKNRVLELYQDGESLNRIALDVFGKKGGAYNNKIREILKEYNIQD